MAIQQSSDPTHQPYIEWTPLFIWYKMDNIYITYDFHDSSPYDGHHIWHMISTMNHLNISSCSDGDGDNSIWHDMMYIVLYIIIISTDFKFLPPQMETPTVVWMKQLKVCKMVFLDVWQRSCWHRNYDDYDDYDGMLIKKIRLKTNKIYDHEGKWPGWCYHGVTLSHSKKMHIIQQFYDWMRWG